ncbi:MAG: ferredoxin [Pseudomonadota bacterium]
MRYAALETAAHARHLTILGGFHPTPKDNAPKACQTLLMLGPHEPAFWPAFKQSPEWLDGARDPMDRWSTRVVGAWADELGAMALYPFGPPPYLPFYAWALRTGRVHASPVKLLVHDTAGLFVSFRGALALKERIVLPNPPPAPCGACETTPCTSACSSRALTVTGYNVPACRAFLETALGADNIANGCHVRRSCPVSKTFGRLEGQSSYHMRQFHNPAK